MEIDNLEELRVRLLCEENVQHMIRVRAYEIYRMRGAQPGAAVGDWLQAESEVLAFVLAHESHEKPAVTSASEAQEKAPEQKKTRSRAVSKVPSTKKGERVKAAPKQTASKKASEPATKSKRARKKQDRDDRS